MKKLTGIFLLLISQLLYSQTITIPATTIPYNPATNTISLPAINLSVTPAPVPATVYLTIPEFNAKKLHIVSVEFKSGIHEITGYNTAGNLETYKVKFGRGNVLPDMYFTTPKFAIITVPFKIRGGVDTFPSKAQAGLTNIGLSLNMVNYRIDRYFAAGNKSTHTFSAGIFVAPNVEEISPETTKNRVAQKSSQLFLSTGVSITYAYGDVSFVFVPLGFDFGMSSSAKKYIYDGKHWWGFGLGVSTKIFGML